MLLIVSCWCVRKYILLTDWLTDCLAGWLAGWLADWLTDFVLSRTLHIASIKAFINSFQSYLFRDKCWLSYFSNRNAKIALMRVSMVVTYYIKLFRTGTDRHNDILMSLLFLVAESKRFYDNFSSSNAPSRLHGLREIVLPWRQEIVKLKTSSRHVLITSSRRLGEQRMFTRNCLSTIYVMLFLF